MMKTLMTALLYDYVCVMSCEVEKINFGMKEVCIMSRVGIELTPSEYQKGIPSRTPLEEDQRLYEILICSLLGHERLGLSYDVFELYLEYE